MDTITKPAIAVIVKRYDEPERYGYHMWNWKVSTWAVENAPMRYIEDSPFLMNKPTKELTLRKLEREGFVPPGKEFWTEEVVNVITNSLPIEFQREFADGDSKMMDRITVLFQLTNELIQTRLTEISNELMAPEKREPAYGQCTHCGAIETRLNRVHGYRDLSEMGESPRYPYGFGCELCD